MKNGALDTDRSDGSRISLGSVYRDLLGWSASLPRWQQELLRRLLHRETLSPDDLNELSTAAVAETEQQASSYAALSVADLPSIATREEPHTLVAIQNLRNVNVLREDQSLNFGPQLTVVYGDNASGKSGYGRVLKKVYRARVIEDILSDVRADAAPAGVATATFVTKTPTGQKQSFDWADDGSPASNLARFAVLDAACSRTYVRGGSLNAGPAGIDLPGRSQGKALRAGLYARVSTHDQKTLPLQLSAMRDYAKKRGWAVALEVQDVGSGATTRPQREKLIEAARR